MATRNFLQESKRFEIQAYKTPRNLTELRKTHVPFSGSPRKHPYDPKKVILIPDPSSSSLFYYEFKSGDISYAEKLPSIVSLDGDTMTMVRLWVKKMSVGMLCSPFFVEDIKPGKTIP
jgi:inorganic pyrophosphatase